MCYEYQRFIYDLMDCVVTFSTAVGILAMIVHAEELKLLAHQMPQHVRNGLHWLWHRLSD